MRLRETEKTMARVITTGPEYRKLMALGRHCIQAEALKDVLPQNYAKALAAWKAQQRVCGVA